MYLDISNLITLWRMSPLCAHLVQGRPGEWARLKKAQVQKMFAGRAQWLICAYHKTVRTWGEAGKFIPPSLARGMEVYLLIGEFAGYGGGAWCDTYPKSK